MTSMVGYVIPSLQFLGIVQVFILLADLQVSVPVFVFAWGCPVLSQLWLIVAGTLSWYFLGRMAKQIFC